MIKNFKNINLSSQIFNSRRDYIIIKYVSIIIINVSILLRSFLDVFCVPL